ncbi:UNVERIFIED_CONTAM: hypothetical protein Sindi_0663800, partial [Sesamum indicum]
AGAFFQALSVKFIGIRKRQTETNQKNRKLKPQLKEMRAKEKKWEEERVAFEAKAKDQDELRASEVARAEAVASELALAEGKEVGFSAGHAAGRIQGAMEVREEFLNSEEFTDRARILWLEGARDFLKTPTFHIAVEIKASTYMNDGFNKCKAHVNCLQAFKEGFNQSCLNPILDENLQPYAPEPLVETETNEFASLLDEIETQNE